jgi:hypothetical protein
MGMKRLIALVFAVALIAASTASSTGPLTLKASPSHINFGRVPDGNITDAVQVFFTNVDKDAAVLAAHAQWAPGTESPPFVIGFDGCLNVIVGVDQFCYVILRFDNNSVSPGRYTGQLQVVDPGAGVIGEATVRGTALPPN